MNFTKNIPNLLTVSNLLIGCVAIVKIFANDTSVACLLVFAAAVIDFSDGFVARLLNAKSDIGKELDSLADVVTFGVVPGMLIYQLLATAWRIETRAFDTTEMYFMPAFIISACAAWRLAKFNITSSAQTDRFLGLPTPMMACTIASLPLILFSANDYTSHIILHKYFLYGVVALMSWLMVSNIPLMNLKPAAYTFKGNELRLLLIAIGIVSFVLIRYEAVPVVFSCYILFSLVQFSFINKKSN